MSTNTQHAPAAPAHHPICDRKRFNPLCQGCEAERSASQATAAAPVESAPGAELFIGVAVGMEHEGATVVIQQQLAGGRVAVIYTGTHRKGESTGRAALCTKTEGGELLTPGQRLHIADAVRKAFPHVHVSHNVYDQIAWNTEQACYVAASSQLVKARILQARAQDALTPLVEYPLAAGSPSDTVLIGSGNWKLTVGDIERARQVAGLQPPNKQQGELTQAARDVLAERRRQVEKRGYNIEHDDEHQNDEIAALATYYAMPPAVRDWPARETGYGSTWGRAIMPLNWVASNIGDRRRELVKAGALILAEIERLDRAALSRREE